MVKKIDAKELVGVLVANKEKILKEIIKEELVEMFKRKIDPETICIEKGHDIDVNYKVKICESSINMMNNLFDKIVSFILEYCEKR